MVTSGTPRRVRADAVRNAERLVTAARETFAAHGVEASLEDVARHAGVGIATLYRHFPKKEDLIQAVLHQAFTQEIGPEIERAMREPDARRAIGIVVEAALRSISRERNTLAAASHSGALTAEIIARFVDPIATLVARGQQAGAIRADLVPEDLLRIVLMLSGVLWTLPPGSEGWRRYVALTLDALNPVGASPLPPAEPLPGDLPPQRWSL
ncbi:AcrR family transcriptional regulator [Catenuloplanes nepalensis]|uniref:AcrR family transcriptional regulator n=1 Tax=Catenuloplanes nepalensis TaxID=587533 RepID=A0ABT9MNN1_9ACTN|nr:TetR/AcrR family transcriptional regulator [Catenuloplanes nepalensis]MDP9793031.1 AcrR family transcriptional regulator [Catenuloplanes nepalensis]